MHLTVGILTISDRASAGVYEDKSGAAIRDVLTRWIASSWTAEYRLVPDEQPTIEATLCELSDVLHCSLIVTTGGTGPSPRDVTPEATVAVCDRLLPGFGEQMRAVSVRTVPTAILSRQVAGTRGSTLIINLPGKPAAIEECLSAVFAAIPYCVELIGGPRFTGTSEAPSAFRPAGA
ncbi:MAG: molybdopterin adenylyltransferase [Phycisphaerae bacterium]|nr:molybdopterin adenylyltransferase [Gemmatimonadaceae bacterium]